MGNALSIPAVSVIIPVINREKLITQTLESLKAQSYSQWETIIVDDGSTDATCKVTKRYINDDPRFRLINKKSSQNKGQQASRNIGIREALGDFLIFLDSDDLLSSNCLESRIDFMRKNPELDFAVFPQLIFHNEMDDNKTLINIETKEDAIDRFLRLAHHAQDVPWLSTSAIWRKLSLARNDLYWDENIVWDDVWFHFKAIVYGLKFKMVSSKPDCYYRMHDEARAGDIIHTPEGLLSHEDMLLKMYTILEKKKLANDERKQAIRRIFFWVVIEEYTKDQMYKEAISACRRFKSSGILSSTQYFGFLQFIIICLVLNEHKTLRYYYNRIMRLIWCSSIYKKYPANYLKHIYC